MGNQWSIYYTVYKQRVLHKIQIFEGTGDTSFTQLNTVSQWNDVVMCNCSLHNLVHSVTNKKKGLTFLVTAFV